jgi:hypothetical protein
MVYLLAITISPLKDLSENPHSSRQCHFEEFYDVGLNTSWLAELATELHPYRNSVVDRSKER